MTMTFYLRIFKDLRIFASFAFKWPIEIRVNSLNGGWVKVEFQDLNVKICDKLKQDIIR